MKLFIKIIWILTFSNILAEAAEPETVCFATINSTEEKETFIKNLNRGQNKKKFRFVELTNMHKGAEGKSGWFDNACKSGVKCDILAISGHFGGVFFGRRNLELPIDTLQKYSCENKCANILSHPKEVFLFGCNTLASKEKDNRTPEQYLQVLLDDNIDMETALRTVERRYSPTGSSFKDMMQRSFVDVPHIYGFHSIGPSGETIKPFLQKYFTAVPNYKEHLDQIETKRQLVLKEQDMTKWCSDNADLATSLDVTAFRQCSGASSAVHNNHRSNVCSLISEDKTIEEKMKLFLKIADEGELDAYLENLEELMKQIDNDEKETFLNNSHIVAELTKLKDKVSKDISKLGFFQMLTKAHIMSQSDFTVLESQLLRKSLLNATRSTVDTFQGYYQDDHEIKVSLSDDEIKKIITNEYAIGITGSLTITNDRFYQELGKSFDPKESTPMNFHIFKNLAKSPAYRSMVIDQCRDHLMRESKHLIYSACLMADQIKKIAITDVELFRLMIGQYFQKPKVKISGFTIDLVDYAYFDTELKSKIMQNAKLQNIVAGELLQTLAVDKFNRFFDIFKDTLIGNDVITNRFLKTADLNRDEDQVSFIAASSLLNYKVLMNKSLALFAKAVAENKKIRLDYRFKAMNGQTIRFLNDSTYSIEVKKTVIQALYHHNLSDEEIKQVGDESLRGLL